MKHKFLMLLFLFASLGVIERVAAAPSISIEYMTFGVNMTDLNLKFAILQPAQDYWTYLTYTIKLKRVGYPDVVTSQQIQAGPATYLMGTFKAGHNYTVSVTDGDGATGSVSFVTDHTISNFNCSQAYPVSTPSVSTITSTSAVINGYFPYQDGKILQNMNVAYRVKGSLSMSGTLYSTSDDYYCLNTPSYCRGSNYIYPSQSATPLNAQALPAVVLNGLQPNTEYELFLMQKATFDTNPFGVYPAPSCYCVGSCSPVFANMSAMTSFKTLDLCESIGGDYTAPALNNDGSVDFYSGTITSSSSIIQSSVKHKFIAGRVVLNPGFKTTISGTGGFTAKAFNPSDCSTASFRAYSGITVTHPSLSDSIVSNIRITIEPIERTPEQNRFIVFPNPTSGILTIKTNTSDEVINTILLSDASGRVVFSSNNNRRRVDISQLPNGLYIYSIQTSYERYSGKLLKQ